MCDSQSIPHSSSIEEKPRICCIIPYYPNHAFLLPAIDSILAQCLPPQETILCVDGESTLHNHFSDTVPITVRHFPEGSGPFAMVDAAIRETSADVISLQDSDDLSHPQRFLLQLETMKAFQLDAVGTNCAHFCKTKVKSFGLFPIHPTTALRQRYGHVVLYPTLMFRRNAYLEVGGFSDFRKFGMDTEFVNRLCLTSRVQNIWMPLYLKRYRANSLTGSPDTGFGSKHRNEIEDFSRNEYNKLINNSS